MAVLTVTIKEEVTLNGSLRTFTNTHTETVDDIYHRIYDVAFGSGNEVDLLKFGTADGGTIADSDLDYLRITNLATANFVTLRILGSSQEYAVKLEAGDSFILNNSVMDANATGSATITLANIDNIKAYSDTAASQVEILAFA